MSKGPVSVVVPARNEAGIITKCVRSILDDPLGSKLDVVVVCNACTDNTAEVADRIAPNVRVIEVAEGSKTIALNAGLHATDGVRHYIDADVVVAPGTVSAITSAMDSSDVWAGAPPLRVDLSTVSPAVRAFLNQWLRAPYFTDRLIGAGYYALAETGQEIIGEFPPLLNEDWYVSSKIPVSRRADVEGCWFTPSLATTFRDLVEIETRHDLGRRQFVVWARQHDVVVGEQAHRSIRDLVRQPSDIWSASVFVGVRLLTSIAARRRTRTQADGWIPTR